METLKKVLFYTFGKISNGILFIVAGFVATMLGIAYRNWICVMVGAAFVALGVVLAFIRETMYVDAVKDVSRLRANQRGLRKSMGELQGRVELLRADLTEANAKIDRLDSVKVVRIGQGKWSATGKKGPAFENRRDKDV